MTPHRSLAKKGDSIVSPGSRGPGLSSGRGKHQRVLLLPIPPSRS